MRYHARLDQRNPDGVSTRDILREKLRRGDVSARERLQGPSFHPGLQHVLTLFSQLAAMRDFDMNGPRRLSPSLIQDGAALFGQSVTPFEAEAILRLDMASLYPGTAQSVATDDKAQPKRETVAAWPTKKAPVDG